MVWGRCEGILGGCGMLWGGCGMLWVGWNGDNIGQWDSVDAATRARLSRVNVNLLVCEYENAGTLIGSMTYWRVLTARRCTVRHN